MSARHSDEYRGYDDSSYYRYSDDAYRGYSSDDSSYYRDCSSSYSCGYTTYSISPSTVSTSDRKDFEGFLTRNKNSVFRYAESLYNGITFDLTAKDPYLQMRIQSFNYDRIFDESLARYVALSVTALTDGVRVRLTTSDADSLRIVRNFVNENIVSYIRRDVVTRPSSSWDQHQNRNRNRRGSYWYTPISNSYVAPTYNPEISKRVYFYGDGVEIQLETADLRLVDTLQKYTQTFLPKNLGSPVSYTIRNTNRGVSVLITSSDSSIRARLYENARSYPAPAGYRFLLLN